jgi:outer membrane protein
VKIGLWLALAPAALAAQAGAQERPIVTGDLTLARSLEIARTTTPAVQAARRIVDASRAAARAAQARRGPAISANAFGTAGNQQSILSTAMMSEPPAFMMVPGGTFGALNLMLMLPISTGGVLEAAIAAARAMADEAAAEAVETEAEVLVAVADSYLGALRFVELRTAEEARVAASEEMLRTARSLFEAGRGIEASVQRAEAEFAQARRRLTSARNEERKSLLTLMQAMGVGFDSDFVLLDRLALADPPFLDVRSAIDLSKRQRARLAAARWRLRAAEAETRVAEGSRRPQIYGVAMADATTRREMAGGATLGVTFSFPLYDSGMRKAEVERARSLADRARALLESEELDVEREVRVAWLDLETATANALSAGVSVRSAEASYRVVADRFAAGRGILVEQLDALEALTRARADLADALYEQQFAAVRLQRAVDGTVAPGKGDPS